jgi:hypothetical protein
MFGWQEEVVAFFSIPTPTVVSALLQDIFILVSVSLSD